MAGLLAVWATLALSNRLSRVFDPRYVVYLVHFSILLFFCYLFWLSAFRALWSHRALWPHRPLRADDVPAHADFAAFAILVGSDNPDGVVVQARFDDR